MAIPDIDAEGYDPQDQAEAFDETHNTDEMGYPDETRSFEPDLFDDVYDATAADGDADEDDDTLDASDLEAADLDEVETDEDEDDVVYLDDDLEDEDDDLVEDDLLIQPSHQHASADEADLEYTDHLDDAGRGADRLARRYESQGELSLSDVQSLGYGQDEKKETDMDPNDKAKGSGASADDVEDESLEHQEELLDEGIEETFPASDPVSVKHIT